MIKLRIEEILHEKRIKKTEFAEMLGIAKQNVNTLLETRNLDKIKEIADALGVDYMDLLVCTLIVVILGDAPKSLL